MMNSTAPVEIETSLAPGAAPWRVVPSLSVTGLPATMPLTWVPWPPPERVSLSTTAGSFCTEQASSNGSHSVLRLATTALEPSASAKAGCVGSTPESMTATETPVPVSAVPSAPVWVCPASRPRVAVLDVASRSSIGCLPAST